MADSPWRDLGIRAVSAVPLGAVGLLAMWLGGALWAAIVIALGGGMLVEWAGMCRRRRRLWPLGLLYIGPAIAALIWLRALPDGLQRTLFLAAIVWAGDIGAYVAGRWIGGPRLAPRISPGKTWSGALGGTACAMAAGLAVWQLWSGGLIAPLLAAFVLSLVAQAGDLLESAMKRHFGVKDSSRLIPGHGGLLDRLDGVLTAAPLAACFALIPWP